MTLPLGQRTLRERSAPVVYVSDSPNPRVFVTGLVKIP